jgi:glutathione synthase/RimK-type ligase-like ATP-grasp enzyme
VALHAPLPDLSRKHRTEPVPPEPHRLVADIDATLEQQVLDLAQRKRISDTHHHRQADDLGRTIEIAEWISRPTTLRTDPTPLKPICSDTAHDRAPIEKHLQYSEMRAGLYGLFRTLSNCFWMNDPSLEESIDNKMVQSIDARYVGLKVPKTLVTNDESSARKFIENCDGGAIIKQLSAIGLVDENSEETETFGFFTSSVTKEAMEYLDEVKHAPCLFQEDIPKKADIRATVVGDRIFAHAIDSQSREASKTDFRKEIDLPISNFEFPDETGSRLIKLLKKWGIIFAACDFVLTPDDELIFLEANVTGNWLWLENEDSHPILDEIVRLLSCKLG